MACMQGASWHIGVPAVHQLGLLEALQVAGVGAEADGVKAKGPAQQQTRRSHRMLRSKRLPSVRYHEAERSEGMLISGALFEDTQCMLATPLISSSRQPWASGMAWSKRCCWLVSTPETSDPGCIPPSPWNVLQICRGVAARQPVARNKEVTPQSLLAPQCQPLSCGTDGK